MFRFLCVSSTIRISFIKYNCVYFFYMKVFFLHTHSWGRNIQNKCKKNEGNKKAHILYNCKDHNTQTISYVNVQQHVLVLHLNAWKKDLLIIEMEKSEKFHSMCSDIEWMRMPYPIPLHDNIILAEKIVFIGPIIMEILSFLSFFPCRRTPCRRILFGVIIIFFKIFFDGWLVRKPEDQEYLFNVIPTTRYNPNSRSNVRQCKIDLQHCSYLETEIVSSLQDTATMYQGIYHLKFYYCIRSLLLFGDKCEN